VFIDGELSCSRDRIALSLSDLDSDLTQWEWVSEPGGLEYLAGRLLQACRPEDSTPPRVWPAAPTPPVTSDHRVPAEDDVAAKDESAQVAGAIAAGTLMETLDED
jgi:hypothetical protein